MHLPRKFRPLSVLILPAFLFCSLLNTVGAALCIGEDDHAHVKIGHLSQELSGGVSRDIILAKIAAVAPQAFSFLSSDSQCPPCIDITFDLFRAPHNVLKRFSGSINTGVLYRLSPMFASRNAFSPTTRTTTIGNGLIPEHVELRSTVVLRI